jgi:hypothetical protein
MPRKLRAAKVPRGLDDYKLAELFSAKRPLITQEGYHRREDGRYYSDDDAIRNAWQRLGKSLVLLWINGWAPSVRFLVPDAKKAGEPGTRPAGLVALLRTAATAATRERDQLPAPRGSPGRGRG